MPDNRFCLPLRWKSGYQRIRKNKTLPRFGTRVEKDMNMKVKVILLVIGALGTKPIKLRKWLKEIDNRVAENCLPTHC